jgi:pimeloyl-ACP methyl ester carboxylesterase
MIRHAWPTPALRSQRIGGLDQAVYEWRLGRNPSETVILLHGWMDSGRTWAPLVSAMDPRRRYLAIDWRGFGVSQRAPDGRYLVSDYIADLDELLAREVPEDESVTLIGHSLGGNVAGLYAGIRPERVRRVISLEGFGLADGEPTQAPSTYRRWLDAQGQRNERYFRSFRELARHIRALNPRLSRAMAVFLAGCWGCPGEAGGVRLRADPAHRHPSPALYRVSEVLACWRAISAPVLWVYGENSRYFEWVRSQPDWASRCAAVPQLNRQGIAGAGHALAHEAPSAVAELIETYWPRQP